MSTTQAEAAVMAQVAARFDSVEESLRSNLSQLRSKVEALGPAWKGSGATSFQAVAAAWSQQQARLLTALAETAEAIRQSGRTYTAVDEAAASRLNTVDLSQLGGS